MQPFPRTGCVEAFSNLLELIPCAFFLLLPRLQVQIHYSFSLVPYELVYLLPANAGSESVPAVLQVLAWRLGAIVHDKFNYTQSQSQILLELLVKLLDHALVQLLGSCPALVLLAQGVVDELHSLAIDVQVHHPPRLVYPNPDLRDVGRVQLPQQVRVEQEKVVDAVGMAEFEQRIHVVDEQLIVFELGCSVAEPLGDELYEVSVAAQRGKGHGLHCLEVGLQCGYLDSGHEEQQRYLCLYIDSRKALVNIVVHSNEEAPIVSQNDELRPEVCIQVNSRHFPGLRENVVPDVTLGDSNDQADNYEWLHIQSMTQFGQHTQLSSLSRYPPPSRRIVRRERELYAQRTIDHQPIEERMDIPILKSVVLPQDRVEKNRRMNIERSNFSMLRRIADISSEYATLRGNDKPMALPVNPRRTRELFRIDQSNLQFLKRLQKPKESEYAVSKMRADWKKQKKILKNISVFPSLSHTRKKSTSFAEKPQTRSTLQTLNSSLDLKNQLPAINAEGEQEELPEQEPLDLDQNCVLKKLCVINYYKFLVQIVLNEDGLTISADNSQFQKLKVINIEKGQALDFVRGQCAGSLLAVFDRLRFDGQCLYLVGRQLEEVANLRELEVKVAEEEICEVQKMRTLIDKRRDDQARQSKAKRSVSRTSNNTGNSGHASFDEKPLY